MIQSEQNIQTAPTYRLLSDEQKGQIHNATLELLQRTGVNVLSVQVREMLSRAGCWVEGERVRIGPERVKWALRTSPERVVLYNRDGEEEICLEGYRTYFGTGSDTPYLIDPHTGERRTTVLQDISNVARLVDALPNIHFLMCMGIASDVTNSISDLYHFREMVCNTSKPIVYTAWNARNLRRIIAMAETVAGGPAALQKSPFCALYSEPIAPLIHARESCEKLLIICEKGLPVVYTPGLITGASSPVTRAGAIVQANAELLSGLVICQLIREGTPVIAGAGGMMTMDMKTTVACYGAPEFMLDWTALCEMGHFYRLPIFGFAGVSDAKIFDEQAAAEGALWVQLAAQAGGNLVHDMGYIESGLTASYEMLVTMDEVAGLVGRLMGGIEVSEETLALDLINEVGPGGHFLGETHTVRHFRKNWYPTLFDRQYRKTWSARGSLSLGERANRRVRQILQEHRPPELPLEIRSKLDESLVLAEQEFGES